MPVHVRCPHCRTSCRVAEQHVGVPVKCGRCGRSFTTRAEVCGQSVRLDLGAAGTGGCFFVQHVVSWERDERHELAVLAIAGDPGLSEAVAALPPLLGSFLAGAGPEVASAAAGIRAAGLAVIWNGHVSIGGEGDCCVYHLSSGRLTRLRREPVKLAACDWLIVVGDSSEPIDEPGLQREMASASSAAGLAEHLAGLGGTVLVVRCY